MLSRFRQARQPAADGRFQERSENRALGASEQEQFPAVPAGDPAPCLSRATDGAPLAIQRLKDELQIPEKAEQAALQLEGVGSDGIGALKAGLTAAMLECRFHAAVALAYRRSGRRGSARRSGSVEPAFRVFALAALSIVDDADAPDLRVAEADERTEHGNEVRGVWRRGCSTRTIRSSRAN